jgi:hypothetical protein
MKVIDIISKYDDISNKDISWEEIKCDIENHITEQPKEFENKAEQLVFNTCLINPEGKFIFEEVFLKLIESFQDKNKVFDYYEKRGGLVQNPILKAVYFSAIIQFKKKCAGSQINLSIIIKWFEIIHTIIDEDYYKYDQHRYNVAWYGFLIASNSKNDNLIEMSKNVLLLLAKKTKSTYILINIFKIAIKNKNIFNRDDMHELIQLLDNMFDNLCADKEKHFVKLLDITKIKLEYYNSEAQPFLNKMHNSFKKLLSIYQNSDYAFCSWDLNNLLELCKKYNFKNEYKLILLEIQKLSKSILTPDNFFEVNMPVKIVINKEIIELLPRKPIEDIIDYILSNIIPAKENVDELLKYKIQKCPFLYSVGINLISSDSTNRIESHIGGFLDDILGLIAYEFRQMIEKNYFLLSSTITALKRKAKKEDYLSYIKVSYSFKNCNKQIIEKSLQSFVDNDFITCVHLMIPQIEKALREILILNDKVYLSDVKNQSHKVVLLENMLNESAIKDFFDINALLFFRMILCDDRGINIRNNVCHGFLSDDSMLGEKEADLLMIVILLIAKSTRCYPPMII